MGHVARGRRAVLFRIALLYRHLLGSGIGGGVARSRWGHLGSRSVSVRSVRGTRGRGKRLGRRPDGRRAARRPCEPPPKASGEICCLEQCPTGRREPRAFLQRRGTNVVVVGRGPMANMGCPRLSAVLGRPHDGSGKRRHDGAHQPARTWGEVRWWCQGRTSALVTLGVGWGLLRAGYRLRPAAVARAKSMPRVGRCLGPPYIPSPGGPERHGEASQRLFPPFISTAGDNNGPENAALSPGPVRAWGPGYFVVAGLILPGGGGFEPFGEDLVFRAGLGQLRLAEPDNVFGDRPEEPVFWAWAILTPIYQRLRRARRCCLSGPSRRSAWI